MELCFLVMVPHALSHVLVIVDTITAGVCCVQNQHEDCSMIFQKERAQGHPYELSICKPRREKALSMTK